MAEAVMFAMLISFLRSRTLVPTMAMYLLKPHVIHDNENDESALPPSRNPLVRFQRGFEHRFERFRASYRGLLELTMLHRRVFILGFLAFVVASFALVPFLGSNFPRRSMAARSSCTCASRSAHESRKPRRVSRISKPRFAKRFRPTKSPRWSTTSA